MRKLTKAQIDVLRRMDPNWLIVEETKTFSLQHGVWLYKDPVAPLVDRVYRRVFGALKFRGLIAYRETVGTRLFYELTKAGKAAQLRSSQVSDI